MSERVLSDKYRSKRSGILYIITGLVVVVFVAFGVVLSLVFSSSQDRLIEKSEDKLINSEVENITSATGYITDLLMPVFNQKAQETPIEDLLRALNTGELTDAQKWIIGEMEREVEMGVMGLERILAVMTSSPVTGTREVIIAASDLSYMTGWELPPYLKDALSEDRSYLILEGGLPEMGLEGEQLVVLKRTRDEQRMVTAYFVGVTSLQAKVDDINAFFAGERDRTRRLIIAVVLVSIAVIVLVTTFFLSYLLRRRITEPINQLSAVAEEVMEGNLDVEVPVRKGEELEKLKTVFNEMVRSIREVINRSVGPD